MLWCKEQGIAENMSMSESEVSSSSSASASKSSEDEEVYDCQFHPYENEPLAEPDDGENNKSLDENEDLDGLTPNFRSKIRKKDERWFLVSPVFLNQILQLEKKKKTFGN